MGEFPKRISVACAFVSVLIPGLATANDEPPLVLKPSSEWHLDYADDSCRLLRIFGEGEDETVFFIERYEPGDSFFVVIGGKTLGSGRSADSLLRFGPGGHEYDGPAQLGDFGKYSPAIMSNGMLLVTPPGFSEEGRDGEESDDPLEETLDADIFGQDISPEQEASITWFEIQRGRRQPARLELGSMGPAMAAMRGCTDELLTHWGIDLEAHRELSRAATPASNYARWVRTDDYPASLWRKGMQGLVQFRLSVGADGKPTQCHIQKSTRPAEFDEAVCEALMNRARFDPALNAQGRPIASYWRNAVRFEIP